MCLFFVRYYNNFSLFYNVFQKLSAKRNLTTKNGHIQCMKKGCIKKMTRKILMVICCIVFVLATAVVVYELIPHQNLNNQQNQTNSNETTQEEYEFQHGGGHDLTPPERVSYENLTNFVIFGVDTRDNAAERGDQFRSDTIMIASLDVENSDLRLISVMRDSKVPIEGHDPQKINAAYKYGGPELAIQTLNENFGLNLKNYVSVDFGKLADIIDILGGVDIEVSEDEAALINEYAEELGYFEHDAHSGLCHLNGKQAVSFSRIRALDSDVGRVSRQQEVMQQLVQNLKTVYQKDYLALLWNVLQCVNTSFSFGELYSIVTDVNVESLDVTTYTMPNETVDPNLWGGIDEHGEWVWIFDVDAVGEAINGIMQRNQAVISEDLELTDEY